MFQLHHRLLNSETGSLVPSGTHSQESTQRGFCGPRRLPWTQLENYSPDSCPWGSNLSKHQNNLVTAQFAAPPPEFLIREVWGGAPLLISAKFLGDAAAVGLGFTLEEALGKMVLSRCFSCYLSGW